MKKLYAFITGALMLGATVATQAQSPRTVLFEEFTGENCGPCAGANPYMKRFSDLNATDSFIHIAYQVPIPSAGPIYNSYKTDANARIGYYGVNFAPYGKQDGQDYPVQGPTTGANSALRNVYYYFDTTSVDNFNTPADQVTPTSPGFTQRRAVSSPCTIAITHSYSAGYDSVYATAIVTTTQNFYASAANSNKMKFRMALVENQLTYLNPPGTNGETEFYQVVRKMLPSATGTNMVDTLLVGRADTFHFAAKIPNYVREKSQLRFIGWVQDDGSKEVKQSGISALVAAPGLVEVLADHDSLPGFSCTNTATSSIGAYLTIKNSGNVAITSLKVDVLAGATNLNSFTWNNNLAPGATAIINAGPIAVPVGNGYPVVTYVLSKPNNLNSYSVSIFDTVRSQTQVFGNSYPAPIVQDFEDTTVYPQNYEATAGEGDFGDIWYPSNYWSYYYSAYHSGVYPNRSFLGAEGTYNSIYFWFYFDTIGAEGNYLLEKADFTGSNRAQMTFWHAHRQYDASTTDEVSVQVSTDCGSTWNTVWSKSGAALATTPVIATPRAPGFGPLQASQWAADTANLNAYAGMNNVWIRFHALSNWGDNAFIDQINISKSTVGGINNLENVEMASVYPTPAKDNITLELGITKDANFDITVVNTLGAEVLAVSNGELAQGPHKIEVNVSNLADGIYNFVIKSGDQKTVKRFVVAH